MMAKAIVVDIYAGEQNTGRLACTSPLNNMDIQVYAGNGLGPGILVVGGTDSS